MSDLDQLERANISCSPSLFSSIFYIDLGQFLSFLAFKADGFRLFLEVLFSCLIVSIVNFLWPFNNLTPTNLTLLWLVVFLTLAIIDQLIFSKVIYLYKKAHILDLKGEQKEALSLLEKIGPNAKRLIRLPKDQYHQLKALILAHTGRFEHAEAESFQARNAGLKVRDYLLIRTEILRSLGDLEKAKLELKHEQDEKISSALLVLEEGFLELEQRQDIKKAARLFREVRQLPAESCFGQENSRVIAQTFLNICGLWTGHAEESLRELSYELGEIRSLALFNEKLRPTAGWCFLERAFYYATHKEPYQALSDLVIASSLCQYPQHLAKTKQIKDELKQRYNL